MTEIYLDLLSAICGGLLIWGFIRKERIYQYPFIMGVIFTSFLLPQAYILVGDPGVTTSARAVERVIIFSCACAFMCWIGYQMKPNIKLLTRLNIPVDDKKVFQAGILLMGCGYLFTYLISRTDIQVAENGNWTGPVTIYYFFSKVIYIAFSIFALQLLKKFTLAKLLCALLSSLPILQLIILDGRRQPTMNFILVIGLSLWLARNRLPPRWLVASSIFVMAILIPLFGALRGGFWELVLSNDWNSLVTASQAAIAKLSTGNVLELRNAALLMDAAERVNTYGFGTGFWDSIVFQYVPGQLVGYDLKAALQFNNIENYNLYSFYGYSIPNGSTPTGIGDSFIEFSYFGCIIFAAIAYLFKMLWISSNKYRSITSQLLYIGLMSPAMLGLTHGIGRFVQEAIFQTLFISLVVFHARVKTGTRQPS